MPSERFYNLPEEKRERIVDAAYEELSKVPYDKLSINKIIKTADIPRGSFYEYFDDKDDLLMFIMKNFSETVSEDIEASFRKNGGDVFAVAEDMYDSITGYAKQSSHKKVCINTFRCFKPGSENMEDLLKITKKQSTDIVNREIQNGNFTIETKREASALWDMIISLLAVNLAKTFTNMDEMDEIREKFMKQLNFIKYGVVRRN